MNYLSAEGLSKTFADKALFTGLSMSIQKGQKIALVGLNGCGKSTLMKIISRIEPADAGIVSVRQDILIGFLDQNPAFEPSTSVMDHILNGTGQIVEAVREYERVISESHDGKVKEKELQAAINHMDVNGAWDLEQRVREVVSRLGIHDLLQPMGTLSGGQVKRVSLAGLLIQAPDLIILDEPTNHLDTSMIEWLEDYLSGRNMTVLMVTHDRYFLERVCDTILELDEGKLYSYNGNYAYFLEKKTMREEAEASELSKDKNILRNELEWVRRMPKARTTKSKSRMDAYEDLKAKTSIQRTETKLVLDVKPPRLGGKILEMKHVYKSYGEKKLIHNFSHTFKNFERIGIIGANGTGKTSFLNIITGMIEADSGKVNHGENTVYGYFSQSGLKFKDDQRVIELVKEHAEVIELASGSKITASQFLTHFGFPYEKQHTFIRKLSGGERKRLQLLTVLVKNPNFLILDEPTNDLDLITLNTLEEFLLYFKGCLIIVSHDRYFMDKLADHLFVFQGEGKISGFPGSYSQYRLALEESKKEYQDSGSTKSEGTSQQIQPETQGKKRNYKEEKELAALDKEIKQLEEKKAELTLLMNQEGVSYDQVSVWGNQIRQTIELIESKTLRWLELSEME